MHLPQIAWEKVCSIWWMGMAVGKVELLLVFSGRDVNRSAKATSSIERGFGMKYA